MSRKSLTCKNHNTTGKRKWRTVREQIVIFLVYNHMWSYQLRMRIHTGFHRLTQIIKLSKLTSCKWPGKMFSFYNFRELNAPSMNQKPGKDKSTKIPGVACPGAPIETCSLGPSFRKWFSIRNLTVFILDARLRIFRGPCKDEITWDQAQF